jgi:sporulation protein YlmC with PRC-barrel domain
MALIRPMGRRWSDRGPHGRAARLRDARIRRMSEATSARELSEQFVSLAAVLGVRVTDASGRSVGRLRDVVVHWTEASTHPPVTGIVVRSGESDFFVGSRWIELDPPASVRLRSSSAYAHRVERDPGDVALAGDVLDRQVVDQDGVELMRPADIYLTRIGGRTELAGFDIGVVALVRRLGPRRLRTCLRTARVIDWATVRSFSPSRPQAGGRGRRDELAGAAGTGLALGQSAEEVHAMRPGEVDAALRKAREEAS